jgi:cholesterol transport system auxiliary component
MRKTLIFFLWIFISGCAVKMPVVSTYVFTAPTPTNMSQSAQTAEVLLISTMTADPGYRTDRMIYVSVPAYLRPYARHAWVAPPAQMLMPLLAAHIESKKYFRAVVVPPFAGSSTYRLDTRLNVLQQEFTQPISQVRCVVQVLLMNNISGRVIASRQFQAIVSAPGNNPASGVAAANQAANQISEQIAQFIVANISKK